MHKYGFSPAFIGVCFAIPGIIYAALSPLMYLFTERMPKRAVILIGIVLMSIGMFFVGTSKTLGLENNPAMIILGLMIIGASAGMISIPVLPEMLEAVEKESDRDYDQEELNDFIAGIFVTSTGLGEFAGPLLSSVLNEAYGFREAQDTYATIVLIFAGFYFIFTGHIHIFLRKPMEQKMSDRVEPKHVEMSTEMNNQPFYTPDLTAKEDSVSVRD
jgi:MFS family permease